MTVIYSNRNIKNLEGRYIAPFRFDGKIELGATKVYTDNAKIKALYESKNITVVAINKPRNTETL